MGNCVGSEQGWKSCRKQAGGELCRKQAGEIISETSCGGNCVGRELQGKNCVRNKLGETLCRKGAGRGNCVGRELGGKLRRKQAGGEIVSEGSWGGNSVEEMNFASKKIETMLH